MAVVILAAVLPLLLTTCEKDRDRFSPCDYVIVEAQETPVPVFLGVCTEHADSVTGMRPLMEEVSSAEDLITIIERRDLQEEIGPVAVFVASAKPSTEGTRNAPRFCLLQKESVQMLVLRAAGCPGAAESQQILQTASRVARELSWALLDPNGQARFRNAVLQELEGSAVHVEDVRLLNYGIDEPVP